MTTKMCLTRPSYDIIKHFKIQLKYLLKLNERLVESLFDHSDIMPEQFYIIEMNQIKENQEAWNKAKGIFEMAMSWSKDGYCDTAEMDNKWESLYRLEHDIEIAEFKQLCIIEDVKQKKKKKKQLK